MTFRNALDTTRVALRERSRHCTIKEAAQPYNRFPADTHTILDLWTQLFHSRWPSPDPNNVGFPRGVSDHAEQERSQISFIHVSQSELMRELSWTDLQVDRLFVTVPYPFTLSDATASATSLPIRNFLSSTSKRLELLINGQNSPSMTPIYTVFVLHLELQFRDRECQQIHHEQSCHCVNSPDR